MSTDRLPPLARLAGAIVTALAAVSSGHANVIVVDSSCTLDKAIDTANFDAPVEGCAVAGSGRDTIRINGANTVLTAELPSIVSDIDFVGIGATPRAITGDGMHRLFFIGDEGTAPSVTFTNFAFDAGVAHGGNAVDGNGAGGGAGAGAGMGGALFIVSGNVGVSASVFDSNTAVGGSTAGYVRYGTDNTGSGSGGGGGIFGTGGAGADEYNNGYAGGSGGFGGGGGGGGDTYPTDAGGSNGGFGGGGAACGGYGGTGGIAGSYNPGSGEFGGGGGGGAGSANGQTPGQSAAPGGFGGGGGGGGGAGGNVNSFVAGDGGAGGFGAGGGAGGSSSPYGNGGAGGNGGFGGGAGAGGLGNYRGASGGPGFGGGDVFEGGGGGGAGFGGAIFIRSGTLALSGNQFNNNSSNIGTNSGNAGIGKGGAVFALHILHNANGNDQGMPLALPEVTGCGNRFTGNSASNAASDDLDNPSTFGTNLAALEQACDGIFNDGFD